jgi:hypothetical protein
MDAAATSLVTSRASQSQVLLHVAKIMEVFTGHKKTLLRRDSVFSRYYRAFLKFLVPIEPLSL